LERLPKHPRRFTYDEDERPPIAIIGSRARSVVSGVIHDYPYMRVILRSAAYAADGYTDGEGSFRIERLPAGAYRLSVPGAGIVQLGIELDGKNHVELEIGKPETQPETPGETAREGWRVRVEDAGSHPGLSLIRVSVEGMTDLPVRIYTEGWEGFSRRTGSKPEYGPFALEFSPLSPGQYIIEPQDLGVQARVKLESNQALTVVFRRLRPHETPDEEEPAQSGVSGRIRHGAGLRVILQHADGMKLETIADEEGGFSFDELPAGEYDLWLPDLDLHREIELDGKHQTSLELDAPQVETPRYSTISGRVMNGSGRVIVLKGPDGPLETEIGPDEGYLFAGLGPGQYYVRVKDTLLRRGGLKMTGRNHRQVNFAIPVAEPSESVLYGQVPGGAHWQVYVRGPKNMEAVQPLDEEGRFEITDLKAGEYEIILQTSDADYIEHVSLDGRARVQVAFHIAAAGADEIAQGEAGAPNETPDAAISLQTSPWTWHVEDTGPGPGFAVVRVRIPHGEGRPVRLWADGWSGMVRRIGDKPEFGPDVCEFAPLGQGSYYLQPEGLAEPVRIDAPGSREIWVTFTPGEEETSPTSPQPTPVHDDPLFILVRSMPYDRPGFIQTLRFAAQNNVRFGDDIEDALRAKKVIVLADTEDFSEEEQARLETAGCQVVRIAPPYYATELRTDNESHD
jgi:hypothetical protein